MKRTASASWTGDLKSGKGTLSTGSGVFKNTPYSFQTRFGSQAGTNPEELIAAAHAGCFTMAFSALLSNAGFTPETLHTEASATLEQVNNNWTLTNIELTLTGRVPKITPEKFQEIANDAKNNCPISRVLKANIHLTATLQ